MLSHVFLARNLAAVRFIERLSPTLFVGEKVADGRMRGQSLHTIELMANAASYELPYRFSALAEKLFVVLKRPSSAFGTFSPSKKRLG